MNSADFLEVVPLKICIRNYNILQLQLVNANTNQFCAIFIYQISAKMGIQGLLKFLQPITIKQHISSFQCKTAAIDMMSWLYKGCYRCAYELNQNIESDMFLSFIFEMLDLLSYYKIKPICVFDGRFVGRKGETIEKRRKAREENRQKGMDYLEKGNEEQARKYLSRCIVIDERVVATAMRALHTRGIEFMVAPYESDSQIAKLCKLGLADFAITEDSDLVVYGARVVLKLSQEGDCDYIDLDRWTAEDVDSEFVKLFLQLDYVGRLEAAVLSGCDYSSSVKGIGIKRAVKKLSEFKTINRVIQHLRGLKTYSQSVPYNYERQVLQSKLIFLFATTYNPATKSLEYLNEGTPQDISDQELQTIVGRRYEYSEGMRLGTTNIRTLANRQIYQIDIKTAVSIHPNLQAKERDNRQRRCLQAAGHQRREEQRQVMAENGNIYNMATLSKKSKAIEAGVLAEEEKQSQARKAERVKRFNDAKQLLNDYMIECSSGQNSNVYSSQIMEELHEEVGKQKALQSEGSTFSDNESNSCLGVVNPWLKE